MQTAPIKNTTSESFADRIRFSVRNRRSILRRRIESQSAAARSAKTWRSALARLNSDEVRDAIYQSLSKLAPKERSGINKELIQQLQLARINVGSRLFILGIPTRSVEDLTPSDMAMLLRSVHMSNPAIMKTVSGVFDQFISHNGLSQAIRAA